MIKANPVLYNSSKKPHRTTFAITFPRTEKDCKAIR